MKFLLILLCSLSLPDSSGYFLEGDNVIFLYVGKVKEDAYVSGNFNKWCKDDEAWKLQFDENTKAWKLTVPKKEIKVLSQDFYEFTFRVDGVLVDANKDNEHVIHCVGYGYRYVLSGL